MITIEGLSELRGKQFMTWEMDEVGLILHFTDGTQLHIVEAAAGVIVEAISDG